MDSDLQDITDRLTHAAQRARPWDAPTAPLIRRVKFRRRVRSTAVAAMACLAVGGATVAVRAAAPSTRPLPANSRPVTPAAALPAKLRPAAAAGLVGTWRPAAAAGLSRYLTVNADHSWRSSDGCHIQVGRWTVPEPGVVLTVVANGTARSYCAGEDKMPVFGLARGAGFDGTTLVLTDAAGNEIGRLRR